MAERKIAPVSSNEDKSHTYRVQLGKYKRAVQNEFYFEALLIDYAMLEDRLRAMLYHMAFIAKRNDLTVWKKTRPYLQNMVSEYKGEKENDTLGLKNISGKIKLVRSVLLWVNNVETGYQNDKFLVKLKNQCESLDIGGILETLSVQSGHENREYPQANKRFGIHRCESS